MTRRFEQIPKVPDGAPFYLRPFLSAVKSHIDALQGVLTTKDRRPTLSEFESIKLKTRSVRSEEAFVFDELVYPAGMLRSSGSAAWDSTRIGWSFANGVTSGVEGTNKLSPAYAEGTGINIHMHWMPTTGSAGNIRIDFSYRFYDATDVMPSWTVGTSFDLAVPGTADKMVFTEIVDVSGTNLKRNSFVDIKIDRAGAHANDTYAGSMVLKQIDVRHRVRSELPRGLGQRSVYVQ